MLIYDRSDFLQILICQQSGCGLLLDNCPSTPLQVQATILMLNRQVHRVEQILQHAVVNVQN